MYLWRCRDVRARGGERVGGDRWQGGSSPGHGLAVIQGLTQFRGSGDAIIGKGLVYNGERGGHRGCEKNLIQCFHVFFCVFFSFGGSRLIGAVPPVYTSGNAKTLRKWWDRHLACS